MLLATSVASIAVGQRQTLVSTQCKAACECNIVCVCVWLPPPHQARQLILQHGLCLSDLDRHPEVREAPAALVNLLRRHC